MLVPHLPVTAPNPATSVLTPQVQGIPFGHRIVTAAHGIDQMTTGTRNAVLLRAVLEMLSLRPVTRKMRVKEQGSIV